MMVRGRKPKPTRERRLNASAAEKPLLADVAVADVEPTKPADLTPTESTLWDQTEKDLRTMGLFKRADQGCIRGYVRSLALALETDAMARKEGLVIDTPHGKKRHPATTLSRESWVAVRSFASELGLSPAIRSRMKATVEREENELLRFLAAGPEGNSRRRNRTDA